MDPEKMEQETTAGAEEERAHTSNEEADFLAGFDEGDTPAQEAEPDDTGDPAQDTLPEDAPAEGGEEDTPSEPPPAEDPAPEEPPDEKVAETPSEETVRLTRYIDAMEGQCRDMYERVRMYEPIDRLAALQSTTPEEMAKQLAEGFERALVEGLCNEKGYSEEAARELLEMQKKVTGQGYQAYQPKELPKEVSFDKSFAELCAMAPDAKGLKELPEGVAAYLKEGNPLPLAWFRHQTAALSKELEETKQKLAVAKQNAHNQKAAPRPVSGVPASAQGDAFLLGFNEE